MVSFETISESKKFMESEIDTRVTDNKECVNGITFQTSSHDLGQGKFTNIYDLGFSAREMLPGIRIHEQLTSVHDYMTQTSENIAATVGGFFFLADKFSCAPRQLALNMAVAEGVANSLPVVDRETLVLTGGQFSFQKVAALGNLCLGGREVSWSGSLTEHETDCKVFGNGNAIIKHEDDVRAGKIRVLQEESKFTPEISCDDIVDMGFIYCGNGKYLKNQISKTGGVDIFAHDFVIRCPEKYADGGGELRILTIGSLALDKCLGGLSVGPSLFEEDLEGHPINHDKSLGSNPPLGKIPLARTVIYNSQDGMTHIRLYDGRPGSYSFPGVTPEEAGQILAKEQDVEWACFLDSGQTSKLCIRADKDGSVDSFGNRHYIKWPQEQNGKYEWVPAAGRPVASMITLQ